MKNFEDEIVRATNVKKLCDITSSKSNKDFKKDFISLKDCSSVLDKHQFDIKKMWNQAVPVPFSPTIMNNGVKYVLIN